jgi:undecaprenyl-diphosphatase
MNILHALILGIVQGVTELLPISSSAHLILVPRFLNWQTNSLAFDTTLHLGTALALTVYFFKDIVSIARGFFTDLSRQKFNINKYSKEGLLGVGIMIGSLPAGLLGILLGNFLEERFRGVGSVLAFLIVGSVLMIFAEVFSKPKIKNIKEINAPKSFFIGLFQSLALFSGVSRSGATISGGMLLGLERSLAAKYSFLLSIPIVIGAGVFEAIKSFGQLSSLSAASILVGFLASFLSGLLAIRFLMGFLGKHKLTGFIVYRVVLIVVISLML